MNFRRDTLRNEKIPGEFPTAAVKEADGRRVRKLRGVIYLHKTLIPSGSEQAEEEETVERQMKDVGERQGREMWVISKCCRLRYLCYSATAEGRLHSLSACGAS